MAGLKCDLSFCLCLFSVSSLVAVVFFFVIIYHVKGGPPVWQTAVSAGCSAGVCLLLQAAGSGLASLCCVLADHGLWSWRCGCWLRFLALQPFLIIARRKLTLIKYQPATEARPACVMKKKKKENHRPFFFEFSGGVM